MKQQTKNWVEIRSCCQVTRWNVLQRNTRWG